MLQPIHGVEADPITADLVVLSRSRLVMQQLLLRCVIDPLDASAIEAAYVMHQMLADDITAVRGRLRRSLGTTSCG